MTASTMSQSTSNFFVPLVEDDTLGVGDEVVQLTAKSEDVSFHSPLLPGASVTSCPMWPGANIWKPQGDHEVLKHSLKWTWI